MEGSWLVHNAHKCNSTANCASLTSALFAPIGWLLNLCISCNAIIEMVSLRVTVHCKPASRLLLLPLHSCTSKQLINTCSLYTFLANVGTCVVFNELWTCLGICDVKEASCQEKFVMWEIVDALYKVCTCAPSLLQPWLPACLVTRISGDGEQAQLCKNLDGVIFAKPMFWVKQILQKRHVFKGTVF